MNSWTCLMVQRGPGMISDEVRSALTVAACRLQLNRHDASRISSDVCDGYIETAWDTHLVGTRSGVLFKTQLDCDEGTYEVNFLLSEDDLASGAAELERISLAGEGEWVQGDGKIPVPALYDFLDLPSTRAN